MFGTSGRSMRLALMYMIQQQEAAQADLKAREEREMAEAKRQFEIEQRQQENQLQTERAQSKKTRTQDSIMRLGGTTGFRSLLSGRKGGGGFGPRSLLDAA